MFCVLLAFLIDNSSCTFQPCVHLQHNRSLGLQTHATSFTHEHKLCPPLHCSTLIGFNKVYNCLNLLLLLLFDAARTLQRPLLYKYQLDICWISAKPTCIESWSICSSPCMNTLCSLLATGEIHTVPHLSSLHFVAL